MNMKKSLFTLAALLLWIAAGAQSIGQALASSLLKAGAEGLPLLFFPASTAAAAKKASFSERSCAFSALRLGIISVCGISQMQALWWEMPVQ